MIQIDSYTYNILVHVVQNDCLRHELLIGQDFLSKVELHSKGSNLTITPLSTADHILEVCQVEATNIDDDIVDLTQTPTAYRNTLKTIVAEYKPDVNVSTDIEMNIIVKDEIPVYQRARRLAQAERDKVNDQIDEWLKDGIVQPSVSEYTSPVVLVKKKNGTDRLCVDYRLLNEKIIKDRYPLPLMEDQLDA